ncbi:Retinol dehydrogenase 13 [Mycena kentingensis (nom. inval.)]|nr:Retinol dehydrogenase 13 [Mycena kentingensis (nom. inval.)]
MEDLIAMTSVSIFGAPNYGGVPFNPATDIPDLVGKVILVTGGASGLGRETVLGLARRGPARIYIADLPRPDDGASLIEELQSLVPDAPLRYLTLDLGSFASIRSAAAAFNAKETRLDICIMNAGVMPVKGSVTVEGYELAWGVNYLGHCLLARLLIPTLLRSATLPDADVRLVFVSSEGHKVTPKGGILFDRLEQPCGDVKYFYRYGQTKLALNILMRQLAAEHPQLTVVSVHPGRVYTYLADELARHSLFVWMSQPLAPLLMVKPEVGARNVLWAACAPVASGGGEQKGRVVSGKYYEPVGIPDRETHLCKDEELGRRLREWTDKALAK